MLILSDVHAYYGRSHILRGIDLRVDAGEIVTLLGRNGVGKTTTIRTILGLTQQRGSIIVNDLEISGKSPFERARAGLALVPEDRRIVEGLTVKENLSIALWAAKGRAGPWSLERILGDFPILSERQNQIGTSLSGGEQQMLAIARAAISNPSVLLIDEPSQGLAPKMVETVRKMIIELNASGIAILLVEQNLALAVGLSTRSYILNKGEIVHSCASSELSESPELLHDLLGV